MLRAKLANSEDEIGTELDLARSDIANWVYGLAASQYSAGSAADKGPWVAYTASSSCEVSIAENRVVPRIQEHALKIEAEPFTDGHILRDTYVLEEAVRPIQDQSLVIGSRSCIRVNELSVCSSD